MNLIILKYSRLSCRKILVKIINYFLRKPVTRTNRHPRKNLKTYAAYRRNSAFEFVIRFAPTCLQISPLMLQATNKLSK